MAQLISIVGGAGFVGRYVVQELAKRGHRLRVVVRDVHRASYLKPLGGVGQVALFAGDVRNRALIDAACADADAVINLVGILAEGGASFDDVAMINSFHVWDGPNFKGTRDEQIVVINKIKAEFIKGPHPAWTAVGTTGLLDPRGVVEIQLIAHVPARP